MFYCDECANENDWPISYVKSWGPCEICKKSACCSDIPSKNLPKTKPKVTHFILVGDKYHV